MQSGMCDDHLDALYYMQSALCRGFHLESLRALAQVYVEHDFLTENEADLFLVDIPILGEHDEQEATVTDQMLAVPDCNMGNLVPSVVTDNFISSFIGCNVSLRVANQFMLPLLGQLVQGSPIC